MVRVERKRNPTLEELQQAHAQRRMVMETPQIPPFDQGNLSTMMDLLEKIASMENRRQKAKLSGDTARVEEIRASQKKLASAEQGQMLRNFEMAFWGRVLAGALAQGVALSLFLSLLPVLTTSASPKRARKLARALSRRTQTASVYALVAKPWLTAVAIWKMPPQLWAAYKSQKAAGK